MSRNPTARERYEQLARTLVAETKAQVKLWQEVPYLALQADGRQNWSERYANAYRYGLWQPQYTVTPGESPFIDCATGKFVLVGSKYQILDEVTDPDRLSPLLARGARDMLNAKSVQQLLRHAAKQQTSVGILENVETLRDHYRRLYNVKPVFTRG